MKKNDLIIPSVESCNSLCQKAETEKISCQRKTCTAAFIACFLSVFAVISFLENAYYFTGTFVFLDIFYLLIIVSAVMTERVINRGEINPLVLPSSLFSRYDIFAHLVGLIQNRVSVMIRRWNRYCEMRSLGCMEPLLNEAQMHESLLSLQEETTRHVQVANILLQMEKEGDSKPQLTAPDDSLATSLEHVRELEDQIRRSLDGVEHRLHDPLSVAANVAALEKEMDQELGVVSPKLKAARAMGRKLTNGS
ncbi:MAG: hypothetical protein UX57_C0002G0043 [Candidatus Uhrbacteria bacterium GW2011_GWE2_46_68]|uniref:Uncharacterized protein n=2 Tax=Candidatus Uhriibacteriota TaxID=1752732 RepID=A0A0G1SHY2_9BACT|nr:MAG: hypothetical protein UX45_C0010G0009 [Candidatus Uhrbacteria bacterium GW2011_GWF2_46_218]KKU41673.1 MAG: hypothetical protein UX57_C0002G0043 [Candidatus Uhrbacteria bacterium GW2011_GWE2_46_68]